VSSAVSGVVSRLVSGGSGVSSGASGVSAPPLVVLPSGSEQPTARAIAKVARTSQSAERSKAAGRVVKVVSLVAVTAC
jgi:hypothetical protein